MTARTSARPKLRSVLVSLLIAAVLLPGCATSLPDSYGRPTVGFDCPPGSQLGRRNDPQGHELACFDRDRKRSGPAASFDEAGALKSVGHFERDRASGFFVLWGEPAAPVIHFTAGGGLPDGLWEEFDANGRRLARLRFRAGVLEGPALWFYPSGEPRTEGRHESDEMEGLWREWFAGGARKSECHYRAGQLHGHCRRWDERGQLRVEGHYESGEAASGFRFWNEAGESIESP
jgi:hypothetical protein